MDFIGEKLDVVVNYLKSNNIKYEIYDNNFSVDGDTKLVTNFQTDEKGIVKLTTGDFIFDIRNKKREQ